MKKLSAEDGKRKDKLVEDIGMAREGLERAIETHNQVVDKSFANVAAALVKYNEAVQEAESFREDIASEIESYFDEKSEKWQEGEAGEQYSAWKDEWENSFDEVEIAEPEELECDELDHGDKLNDLRNSVDD